MIKKATNPINPFARLKNTPQNGEVFKFNWWVSPNTGLKWSYLIGTYISWDCLFLEPFSKKHYKQFFQNPSKSIKIHQNPSESIKIHQNPSKSYNLSNHMIFSLDQRSSCRNRSAHHRRRGWLCLGRRLRVGPLAGFNPRGNMEVLMWKSWENMGQLWEIHGKHMEKHRKYVGESHQFLYDDQIWRCHWSWENHGTIRGGLSSKTCLISGG